MSLLHLLRANRGLVLASLTLLAILFGAGIALKPLVRSTPYFHRVSDVANFAQQHGFCIYAGETDRKGDLGSIYLLDHPLAQNDLPILNTNQAGLTPDWKGVVWASLAVWGDGPDSGMELVLDNFDGHWRRWGKVVVAGDPEFLDRLEKLYQADH
jgi:hypothetical protein